MVCVRCLFALCLLVAAARATADERHRIDFTKERGLDITLLGDASVSSGAEPPLDLTGASPNALGACWIEHVFDARAERLAIHFEASVEALEGPVPAAGPGGGLQLVIQFGDDFTLLGTGGDSLGTGGLSARYLGVALDLGADPPFGPRAPHVDINRDRDPAEDGTIASALRAPDLVSTGSAGATARYTVVLDASGGDDGDARTRIAVFASSDHDCFGGRLVLERRLTIDPLLLSRASIGFIGASAETPAVHRLHAVVIDTRTAAPLFVRGDCNQDGVACGSVTDMIAIIQRCFQGGAELPCEDACDVDDNGSVCGSVTDVVYLANYCFLASGTPPPAPFGECGADASADSLGCASPRACGAGVPPAGLVWLGVNDRGYPEYLRERDGMLLVEIPAGTFEQGDRFFDFGGDELPVHETAITRPFLLAKFETTVAQYRSFLAAIGCNAVACIDYDHRWDFTGPGSEHYDGCHYPAGDAGLAWGRNEVWFERAELDEHPVIWVDWFDAVAYSRWANDERSQDWNDASVYGVPTEAQWEYAARWRGDGSLPARYPWGGSDGRLDDPRNINETFCNFAQVVGQPVEVCTYTLGRSHFGLYNQAGNVYEWTADWYDGDSYQDAAREDPFVATGDSFRQLRGGGWFGASFSQRGAYRCNFEPDHPDIDVGLRSAARAR